LPPLASWHGLTPRQIFALKLGQSQSVLLAPLPVLTLYAHHHLTRFYLKPVQSFPLLDQPDTTQSPKVAGLKGTIKSDFFFRRVHLLYRASLSFS
jgi:hypothetical protein